MTALKDEEVQKLGIVFLWNMINDFNGGHDYAVDMMRIQTISAIPVRPVACYNIFQSKLWNQVIEVQNYMISPKLRARTRSLCGSYSEIMHLLICLGIPYEYILTKKDGEMLLNNPNQWIAERMKIESADWLEYSTARNSTRRKRKRTH